ncbi:MAG: VOC family protein [Pseudomonas profundi]|uniref:VOC family protein n=1 Tax=Pseudomonas profundi TaxID=1981513 RepID=UPI00300301B0
MFSHVTLGTNDLSRARIFYDSVLGALGYENLGNMEKASLWGSGGPRFVVLKPADGNIASVSNGLTVGFAAANRAAVDEFHQRALQAGGTDAGSPGFRDVGPNVYAAYVRDLDGHKIVASCISER